VLDEKGNPDPHYLKILRDDKDLNLPSGTFLELEYVQPVALKKKQSFRKDNKEENTFKGETLKKKIQKNLKNQFLITPSKKTILLEESKIEKKSKKPEIEEKLLPSNEEIIKEKKSTKKTKDLVEEYIPVEEPKKEKKIKEND